MDGLFFRNISPCLHSPRRSASNFVFRLVPHKFADMIKGFGWPSRNTRNTEQGRGEKMNFWRGESERTWKIEATLQVWWFGSERKPNVSYNRIFFSLLFPFLSLSLSLSLCLSFSFDRSVDRLTWLKSRATMIKKREKNFFARPLRIR